MAAFSALLSGLALPSEIFSLGLWPLGLVALAPLYIALKNAGTFREAALAGAVYGALQHAISSYWLFFYKDFALWTIGATTLGYAAAYTVPALYLSHFAKKPKFIGPVLFALAWAVFEYGKSTGFLGYPWGLLPYSLSSLPVTLQIVDITGVYGLSFLLALSSALAAVCTHRDEDHGGSACRIRGMGPHFGFLAFCWLCVLGYGWVCMAEHRSPEKIFRAVIVQQNVDPWLAGEESALVANIELARTALYPAPAGEKYATGEDASARPGPELVIFSETSLRRPYLENEKYYSTTPIDYPLIPFIRESGAWLLTGAPYVVDWSDFKVMNAAILVDPEGKLRDFYGKSHPVPFTEAIPLMEFAWFRAFMKNVVGLEGGWTTGTRLTVFELPLREGGTVRFGVPICFEDAFSGLCGDFVRRGADILVNITNDSWSQTRSAEIQHWAAARFRAIETRRTLVRSTNGGLSCIISPTGINIFELPLFEAASRVVDVPVYSTDALTLYTRFGDWFILLCLLLLALSIILPIARTNRRKS